jgi:prephenate dehydrogenase
MEPGRFKQVTIVGTGLLGGSAGLALKAWDPDVHVAGLGRRQSSLDTALEVGAIDSGHLELADAARDADLVLLATPVGSFEALLAQLKGRIKDSAIVTDVGSTKAKVVAQAERILGHSGRFVGSHPMAGSEQKGPAYARGDLFEGATCILTPTSRSSAEVVDAVEGFWRALGMRTVRMAPEAHDRATARVSHLPHALASLLMSLPEEPDLAVAATGFRDATRLAGGDPEMWRDIFLTNGPAVVEALDDFARRLSTLRELIDAGDADRIQAFLGEARTRREETIAQRLSERRVAFE